MKNWIGKRREYITIVIAFLLFYISPMVLRMMDPTAGAYDLGVIQIPVLATFNFFVDSFTSYFTIKLLWPDLHEFFYVWFKGAFSELTSWQKIKLSVGLFCFFMLMLVLLSRPA